MSFDINLVAGLVAGVAAMVPGAVIYAPGVLGRRWMKEVGITEKEIKDSGEGNKAVGMMLLVSLLNGIVASVFVSTLGAATVADALTISLLLGYFLLSANAVLVFFERRSWTWFGITGLSHVLTFAVIGLVLGLFL